MTSYYNEIDPKAAAWLRELIKAGRIAPGEVDDRDIRDIRVADLHGFAQCHFFAGIGVWSYALRSAGWPDDRPVWTGSCPCQPFSAAGKGGGFDDERHLWPAWFWLIEQCRPAIVFGEQVASKDAEPWIDLVQDDLEAVGYGVGAVPFPAAGIGAPHIRDRLYWVAESGSVGRRAERDAVQPGQSIAGGRSGISGMADASGGGRRELGHPAQPGSVRHADGGKLTGLMGEPLGAGLEGHSGHGDDRDGPGRYRAHPTGPVAETGTIVRVADISGRIGRQGLPAGSVDDRQDAGRIEDHDGPVGFGEVGDARSAAGPTNGLWRDADRLLCRDGKWRPVEPGTFPLVASVAKGMGRGSDSGAPIDPYSGEGRVMRLRGYGNAINAEAAVTFIGSYLGAVE